MNYNHKVIAVTTAYEQEIAQAIDCGTACAIALARNSEPYNIVYVVERPNGERLDAYAQRLVVETSLESIAWS